LENLGKYLLDMRVQRDLSYKKVWEDIRLTEEAIKKMENNKFYDLGGYGIAKAMVFNYARYLEADVAAVMREFSVMMPDDSRKQFNNQHLEKEHKIMISTNFLWMIGILIIILVLGSILLHAYRQGWLSTPIFNREASADSTLANPVKEVEQPAPDTLRSRMRALSKAIPNQNQSTTPAASKKVVPADTTDYMGNVLGNSPVNVPLH